MTLAELIARYKAGNPFAMKAARARLSYSQMTTPTAHEAGMANSFPLGAGFGRKGSGKVIERSVDRAVKAEAFRKEAEWREAQAGAFDAGKINAQGRRPAKNADAARERREALQTREAAADAARVGKEAWEVRGCVYADSARQFGGNGRRFAIATHQDAVEQACRDGKPVPAEVLADYPSLMVMQE